MRTALRRTWLCLRIAGLMAVGAVVAHFAAAGFGVTDRVGPASTASALEPAHKVVVEAQKTAVEPEGKAAAEPARAEPEKTAAADPERLPLPAVSLTANRDARLAEKGMTAGSPVMIRIFKEESQLELWLQKGDRFELFATYPVCRWSGKLGPKLHEGDKQAPEGVYMVSLPQIHRKGRWPRSLNIGYPNAFDRAMARTGSLILVHGGCSSTGCFAMTDAGIDEIYRLSELALSQGQQRIPIHVFPFRMTEAKLAAHADSEWQPFWHNIKQAYDAFERTRLPPAVRVCGKTYVVSEGATPGDAAAAHDSDGADCSDVQTASSQVAEADSGDSQVKVAKTRKVVSKTQRRRATGRNTRKAYAEARKERMAQHAQRARKHASKDD